VPATKPLAEYRAKRDFQKTAEPSPEVRVAKNKQPIFVVQEHHASQLHFDFRLEHDGVLKSWAVPREPSMDPADKHLAVQVEDHPISYAKFFGTVPRGQYGAGEVFIWDRGTFEEVPDTDFNAGLEASKVEFVLDGEKLRGRFTLVRMKGRGDKNWLLIKGHDQFARSTSSLNGQARAPAKPANPRSPSIARRGDSAPEEVEFTNGDRVWFPDDGITKGDVFRYYEAVADRLIPFLRDRPVTLERLPGGIAAGQPHFWQKHTPQYYPSWIPRVDFPTERGRPVQYVIVNDKQTLLYLVNQGTLTFHPWLSRVSDPDRPDFVLFDLDPGGATFQDAITVAKELRRSLAKEGLASVVKTSGKSGLHVLVASNQNGGFDEARGWAKSIAKRLADSLPELATVEIRKPKRGKRVYVDTLQNAKGHHAVPPYVVRPVAGAPVSMPLKWGELTTRLDPRQFTIANAIRRLSRQQSDPMEPLLKAMRINPFRSPRRRPAAAGA
jgi:bifunctional non-homologous end joining protein LigD